VMWRMILMNVMSWRLEQLVSLWKTLCMFDEELVSGGTYVVFWRHFESEMFYKSTSNCLHLLWVIFIYCEIFSTHLVTWKLVIDCEWKIKDWMQWSIHFIFYLFCPCLETSKGYKNATFKAIQKWNVDARCTHLLQRDSSIMVEVINPNDVDGFV
jgi:hypothetical protein